MGTLMLGLYAVGGWLLLRSFAAAHSGVRILIPAYAVLGALIVPAAVNRRIITAGAGGVKVRNGPIPRGRTVDVSREEIRFCNVRLQYSEFEGEDAGSARIANYLAGVETRSGEQVDIAYPYLSLDEAKNVAMQIAAALNQNRLLPPIGLGEAQREPAPDSKWRLKVFAWGGLFAAAILAGVVWEQY